jgi:hydroxymethylpyrimidine pyrophosphatase-like HAD family hydrolase
MENQKLINTIYSMDEIDRHVIRLDPTKTILFFDIDNTLLRTKSDIGSVEWVKWQEKIFTEHKGKHEFSVNKSLEDLYQSYQKWLITSNCETELLEEHVLDLVNKYIFLGFKVVLVTARNKNTANTTFKQLSNHYNINNFYSHSIYFENEWILYKNGICFASGINKGCCIDKLLQIFKLIFDFEPENIVFTDDSLSECTTVMNKFLKNEQNILVFNYLFGQKFQIIFNGLDKNDLHQKWITFIND